MYNICTQELCQRFLLDINWTGVFQAGLRPAKPATGRHAAIRLGSQGRWWWAFPPAPTDNAFVQVPEPQPDAVLRGKAVQSRVTCSRHPVPGRTRQPRPSRFPDWGEERIANELLLKLGIRVSPRTVRKYMPKSPQGRPRGDQRWSTFVRNHASAILACDFCVVVTATFRLLHVFIVIEHQTRRIVHCNVTTNPTAAWTLQQLREAIPSDHGYRFLIHDRDGIFSPHLDQSISHMGLRVLETPPRSPKANSLCERVIGTLRRECLDFFIPLTETHLRSITTNWVAHYNQGRPHSSIGPGIPDPPSDLPVTPQIHRHRIPNHLKVVTHPVLGGLHHEYGLLPKAA